MSKWDLLALLVGPPKHGKSSVSAAIAERELEAGATVLVQDNASEFRRLCVMYKSAGDYLAAAAAAGAAKKPLPRGASFMCLEGGDEVLDLAVALGKEWNLGHDEPRRRILVVVNETSSLASSSSFIHKAAAMAINQRRHLGIGLVLCLQTPGMLPRGVYGVATDVYLFAHQSDDDIKTLEKKTGIASLAQLKALPPRRYLHWQLGDDGRRRLV